MSPTVVVRRHVDARAVSFALAMLQNSESIQQELSVVTRTCATAALQAASALNALLLTCRGAAESRQIKQKLQGADFKRFEAFMQHTEGALGSLYNGPLRETLEVLIVMALGTLDPEEATMFDKWARGIGMDTRALAVHEEDERGEVVLESLGQSAGKKRKRAKNAKELYAQERLDTLVAKAIARGASRVEVTQGNGTMILSACSGKTKPVQIARFKGPEGEAKALAEAINREIALFENNPS